MDPDDSSTPFAAVPAPHVELPSTLTYEGMNARAGSVRSSRTIRAVVVVMLAAVVLGIAAVLLRP